MRFMILIKANKDTEAGVMPSEQLLTDMGKFNEELVKAGVMLAGEGLQPSSKGARVKFIGDRRVVTDGPFAETKELIAGFWLWQCKSKQEAIEWVKRCPNPTGADSQIEIRQVFEAEDFGAEFTPELREQVERLRSQIEKQGATGAAGSGGATTFTTPSDRELAMTRVFDAPRRLVWDAWTNPRHLPHWMLGPEGWTMPVCEMDLRPGGAWHFVWRRSDGTEMGMRGAYREVTPPGRLVSTESWGGDWPETLNTLTLSEKDGRTTMTQTVLYPSKEARDAALKTGMKDGVAKSFDRLAEYLAELA
jgi:uncharacterized protein YndB with AHSA1/START domain